MAAKLRVPGGAYALGVRLPALLVLAVALLTVSYHTLKAARTNPVDSLRSE